MKSFLFPRDGFWRAKLQREQEETGRLRIGRGRWQCSYSAAWMKRRSGSELARSRSRAKESFAKPSSMLPCEHLSKGIQARPQKISGKPPPCTLEGSKTNMI